MCRRIENAEYVLYFIGEQLAAFRLQIVRPDCLIDKYFGMDPVLGREHSLYFISWCKDVEYCIANGIRLYHSGLTEEETKARLGAQFVPSRILFKHRHPFLQRFLMLLARYLAYEPTVPLPSVRLGADWEPWLVGNPVSGAAVAPSLATPGIDYDGNSAAYGMKS